MTEPGSSKEHPRINNNMRIQAYAPVGEYGVERLMIFRRDQIDHISEQAETGCSNIRLYNGMIIPVRLDLLALDRLIYTSPPNTTNTLIDLSAATKDSIPRAFRVGDIMKDGSIFAGISPKTHRPMYVTAAPSLVMTFNNAVTYAAKLTDHGHQDWRIPEKEELNELFNNRALIGGFHLKDPYPAGWCWSSTPHGADSNWAQRFSDGAQSGNYRTSPSSLRCIRS